MSLAGPKLRAVINLLSDERQAHAAAHVLAEEAKRRGVLVADLIAQALAPATPEPPPARQAQPPEPRFHDVGGNADVTVAVGKQISSQVYGLQSEIRRETDLAWLVRSPIDGSDVWIPKSQAERHGTDPVGRSIFVMSAWIARKKGFLS
jgi:hypothetical protein